MNRTLLTDAHVRVEHIPEHKYVGIWDKEAGEYGSFFARHDCDAVCGTIDSMSHVSHPIVTCHTAGWFYENGTRGYFYGFGVPADYDGVIPDGFEIRTFPASDYLVFFHPTFDYPKDCGEVMKSGGRSRVELRSVDKRLRVERGRVPGLSAPLSGGGRI